MPEQGHTILELALSVLSLLIAVLSIIGLIVGSRGVLKARREAYELMHDQFLDLKRRVRDELKKD